MRSFLNGILSFIGSESLTDAEYATIDLQYENYSIATYNALRGVLENRESVSGQLAKLKGYFKIKGTSVADPAIRPSSNIFVGRTLG